LLHGKAAIHADPELDIGGNAENLLHVVAGPLESVDPTAAEAAASIGAHPLDGLGFLVPSSEGRGLTGVLFCSTMFAGGSDRHGAAGGPTAHNPAQPSQVVSPLFQCWSMGI